jgi:hypothetical protein
MESIAVPAVDRGWLDQRQRASPLRPQPSQHQPQQAVRGAKAPIRPSEHGHLVAQREDLEQQVSTR